MKKLKIIGASCLLMAAVVFTSFKVDDRYFEIAKNLDIFATLFKELNSLYVDEINPTQAMNVGIKAMLKELDPYTNFYTEDAIEDYRTITTGRYNGIGVSTSYNAGTHTIVSVQQYSPADKAGLRIGDEIVGVNGIQVVGRTDAELNRLLKGQRNTKVDVEVARITEAKPLKFSIERYTVKPPNVPHYGLIDDKTGYIQLKDFSATAAKEIKAAFEEMKGDGMENLILDLRSNPGGLLDQAVEISNFFIPKDRLVVETKGKVGEWNKKYGTRNQPLDLEMPVVVLINGRSASASEIVSGTLQDYDRGVLIGQRSFGKGLVQVTRPLSYNTQLKVTTAKYYIPSGRCIQAIDYSHRRADGSVGKLPDSLRSTFYTVNRRPVLDGGGVDPDISTEKKEFSEFTKQLIGDKVLFDFGTIYHAQNIENIPDESFSITPEIYQALVDFAKQEGFVFESKMYKNLQMVKSEMENREELQVELGSVASLERKIKEYQNTLFEKYREEISDELELEILSRYHYDKVMKFVSFEKDMEIQEALKLFEDKERYKKILAGN